MVVRATMVVRLTAIGLAVVVCSSAAAGGTRSQHREWIFKHAAPGHGIDTWAAGKDVSGPPLQMRGTRLQHDDWARKFETPGGSIDGGRFHAGVGHSEADVRQLLRCQIMEARDEPDLRPLAGC